MKKRTQEMRRDQKGFSLVELLIAVVIMAVVMAAVCGFIIVGSRSYAAANSDITVQSEAQLSLNQISDVLIDTTRSVNYAGYDASGSMEPVIKDSEFTFEPAAKSLTMYNGVSVETTSGGTTTTSIEEGNGNKNYQFYWDKADETLYYSEIPITDTIFPAPGDPDCVVLAKHVTDFSIDLSQVEEKRVVQISMTFVNGTKEYNTSNNITIRNKVGINDAEIDSINRSKTLSVSCKDNGIVLEPGESYHFSVPVVSGKNVMDKSVTWSMDPAYSGSSYFTDTTNGILQIADDEPAGELKVVITTNAVDSDGNHATLTVPVMIKRATAVTLSKIDDEVAENGPTEVTIGKKFSIQAAVNGVKLGAACNGGCGDDITKDKDVINWQLEGPATRLDTNGDVLKTEYRVNDNAKEGDIITIRATSLLSTKRPYPDVVGEIILTVKKGSEMGDRPIGSGLKYGRDDDENVGQLWDICDNLSKDTTYHVVCVRVRELDETDISKDKILIYFANVDIRFSPDLFGLDLNRSYHLLIQPLDPVPAELRQQNGNIPDNKATIAREYLNPANIDSKGKYIGTRYQAGDLFYGMINPPSIAVTYNGVRYPNNDEDYYESYAMISGAERVFGVPVVLDGDYFNVNHNFLLNNIGFNIYKGEGNDPAGWQRLYGVDEKNTSKDNLRYDSDFYTLAGGAITIKPKENPMIKRDINKRDNLLDACGTYHIVPGFTYANQENLNNRNYLGDHLIYKNFEGDYESHYYEQMQCAITLKIESGMNLELVYQNVNQETISKWTNFPVPTDNSFPFVLQNPEEQSIYYDLGIYSSELSKIGDLRGVTVKCKYIPDAGGSGTYTIELLKEETRGKVKIISNYGTYQCKAGGHKWDIVSSGTIKEDSSWKARVYMTFWSAEFMAEVPLPKDEGFPTDIPDSGEEKEYKIKQIFYRVNDIYGEGEQITRDMLFGYSYDSKTDTYTLSISEPQWQPVLLGVWNCKSNGNEWVKVQ